MIISYKYIKRYKEILRVIVKYGLTFILDKLNIDYVAYKSSEKLMRNNIKNMTTGEKLRRAMEELGPTFVKMGQILSFRTDLLEPEIIEELTKLRYNVEPFDTEIAKEIFYKETNKKIESVFEYFNEEPIAAASIGQVYKCRLKNGEEVVLKIQGPNIEEIIKADIEILRKICNKIDLSKSDISIDLTKIIEEFYTQLIRELDYNFEAMNAMKFKEIFKDSTNVHIPKIYNEYTTKKVLIMEKIIGIKLDNKKRLKEIKWDTDNISKRGMRAFFKQVLEHGFFHAGLHPGNIFVVSSDCIAYIDFGMIGMIDNEMLSNINNLGLAVIQKDIDRIIYILDEMKILNKEVDKIALKQDLLYMIHYYYDTKLEEINVSDIINEVYRFLRKYKMLLPYELSILGKTMITLEGTARELNPTFSIKYMVKELAGDYYEHRFNIERIIEDSTKSIQYLLLEFKYIPKQIGKILKVIENNNLSVDVENIKMDKLEKTINESSTKLSLGIISAAIFVGSSIMISSTNVERYKWIENISIIGFCFATILFIITMVKIFTDKSKK